MTNPTPTAETAPVCCGQGGTWAPEGKPLVAGCTLCPNSGRYWRAGREDQLPVTPLGKREVPR